MSWVALGVLVLVPKGVEAPSPPQILQTELLVLGHKAEEAVSEA